MVKEKWLEHSIDIEETSKFKCEHCTLSVINTLAVYSVDMFFFVIQTVYICF